MEIETVIRGVDASVQITGRITFKDHHDFHRLTDLVNKGYRTLMLDLSQVSFLDSAALGMLLMLHDAATAAGGRLQIKGGGGQVRRVAMTTAIDKVLNWDD